MIRLPRTTASVLILSTAAAFPSSAFRPTLALVASSPKIISRPIFLSQAALFTTTSFAMSSGSKSSCEASAGNMNIDKPLSLLESVYGPIDSKDFPFPMPSDEAGLCADGHQRRYLWTDAFGVLAYTSIADRYEANGNKEEAERYRKACSSLISVVHKCLGSPRSDDKDDVMKVDPKSPTGHVGLRIGKVHSRKVTDYGMSYDGQYWHYVDKWLLALARSDHIDEGIRIAKSCFPAFFDPGDGSGYDGGIRWKLSVDSTAPPSLRSAGAGDDTLVALIVFSILEANRSPGDNTPSLATEIQLLKKALDGYRPRVTDDPLGWGLEAMYDQFLAGHPRTRTLASLHRSALHPSHLSLPFRLYGAMIGARIAGKAVAPPDKVDELIEMSLEHEDKAARRGFEEHSSINRVMLAMCMLCPGALGKRPDDPTIAL